MKLFDILYIDKVGDKQEYQLLAVDVRAAIECTHIHCPDVRRIISAKPSDVQDSN